MCNIFSELGIPTKLIKLIKMRLSEACSKVWLGQSLSAKFPIQSRRKQDDALGSLLFNFALEIATRDVLVNQQRLKSNDTHQLLIFANSLNLLGSNPNIYQKKKTQEL